MSIMSAICAEHTNEALKKYAERLRRAIKDQDWSYVKEIADWMESEPMSE